MYNTEIRNGVEIERRFIPNHNQNTRLLNWRGLSPNEQLNLYLSLNENGTPFFKTSEEASVYGQLRKHVTSNRRSLEQSNHDDLERYLQMKKLGL